MKKIAIISFCHTESSACLAKYIAKQNVEVDYYLIAPIIRDSGIQPGFEYKNAPKYPGIHQLRVKDAPEIINYTDGLCCKWFILRIIWLSPQAEFINAPIWSLALETIRSRHYDAIEIVGQHKWVSIIHRGLKNENIIHTLHEVGSHQDNILSNELITRLIADKSKLIFHSEATRKRFLAINGAGNCKTTVIPFGMFETSLLYERDIFIAHGLNLSKPTFLFYGFIQPYKGLDVLAASMKFLDEYKSLFNLIVAGAGEDPNMSYFQTLENCYVLNRFLTNEEMMKLNRISSIVLLPYHSASQTGIIPTCFLFQKPVIATSVGAFVESVKDGVNGLLVPPDSPLEFSNAMKHCILNPKYIRQLSDGTKLYGKGDDYDWSIIARRHLDFYAQ